MVRFVNALNTTDSTKLIERMRTLSHVIDGTLDELTGANLYLVWIWRQGFGKLEYDKRMLTKEYSGLVEI
jgi:hypothetical protein